MTGLPLHIVDHKKILKFKSQTNFNVCESQIEVVRRNIANEVYMR